MLLPPLEGQQMLLGLCLQQIKIYDILFQAVIVMNVAIEQCPSPNIPVMRYVFVIAALDCVPPAL